MATGVDSFHSPDHTSQKFPCLSFLSNWRVDRSISHSPLQQVSISNMVKGNLWNEGFTEPSTYEGMIYYGHLPSLVQWV